MKIGGETTNKEMLSVSSLNDDLLLLIELGAWQKVLELSRNYNFYNVHGALIYATLSTRNYHIAESALHDLIIGPMRQADHEYLHRIIYILDLLEEYQLNSQSKEIINNANFSVSFRNWQKRLTEDQNTLPSLLKESAILLQKQLSRVFNLSSDVVRSQDSSPTPKLNNVQRDIKDTVFQQALVNIENYISGVSSKFYRNSLLKTDFEYISKMLSHDATKELAVRCGLYDLHPKIALGYCRLGRYDESLAVLNELAANSDLFSSLKNFDLELAKDALLELTLHSAKSASTEAQEENLPLLLELMPLSKKPTALKVCQGHDCLLLGLNEIEDKIRVFESAKILVNPLSLQSLINTIK